MNFCKDMILLALICFTFCLRLNAQTSIELDEFEIITDENVNRIEEVGLLDSEGINVEVLFNPTNTLLVIGGEINQTGNIQIYDLATNREIANLSGHSARVIGLAFNADGSILASGSEDGLIKFWNSASWAEIDTFQITNTVELIKDIEFSTDLQLGASIQGQAVNIFNTSSREILHKLEHINGSFANDLDFSQDNSILVYGSIGGSGIGNSRIHLFDINQGREKYSIQVTDVSDSAIAALISFSPDNQWIASTVWRGTGGEIKIFDTETGVEQLQINQVPLPYEMNKIEFAPSGSLIVSVSGRREYGFTRLWSVNTGEIVNTLDESNEARIRTVAFNADGTLMATVNQNGSAQIWGIRSAG